MHLQTDIKLAFIQKLRTRGYLFTSLGAMLLFVGANVFSIQTLEKVGAWVFLTAIVCIYLGLKPYKEAKKRSLIPDEILIDNNQLQYLHAKQIVLSISIDAIKKIKYRNKKFQYGIYITIKKNNQTHFLPYFSENAYSMLISNTALQNVMHFNQADKF
jgi:hypothetical protein